MPIHAESLGLSVCDLLPNCKSANLQDRLPIVYTGTFETYQGLDLLLNSIPLVKKDFPEAYLIMVGG
ncbi:MAG: glycosyltransferase family 4 protein, partial [Phycisphaerae bacterium]|nr:glycosyltransferase family 4 protein [Phycisphaerae bacterium]NIX30366.1 hypothetical protein [Phycisphaerae bacterium]